jgi:hypothetical protein
MYASASTLLRSLLAVIDLCSLSIVRIQRFEECPLLAVDSTGRSRNGMQRNMEKIRRSAVSLRRVFFLCSRASLPKRARLGPFSGEAVFTS